MFYRRQKEVLPRQNECVQESKGWTYGKAGYMLERIYINVASRYI